MAAIAASTPLIRLPWNAALIECCLDIAEEHLDRETTTLRGMRWWGRLQSVMAGMLSGQRTESDLGEWIAEYALADELGIDVEHLSRRGVL